ncbi:Insulin-like growth factor-binding protein 6 [Apodemus speciosus]|uniref:Insulin-like growth factor-binding protein 6 n=1 Tax=Apodemus speciosus TaxID=105296 RepID=A0ABQ0FL56_APOSI
MREETTKESKPHGGASRSRDTSHRDRQKNPRTSAAPIRPNPVQDSEMGPCRRHLDSVLQQLQTEVFRGGARGLYVPNCDLRGFYRKQQRRLVDPRRGIAVVPAGVWILWASLCQCLQMAKETLSAPAGAVDEASNPHPTPPPWEPPGHQQEHGTVI